MLTFEPLGLERGVLALEALCASRTSFDATNGADLSLPIGPCEVSMTLREAGRLYADLLRRLHDGGLP